MNKLHPEYYYHAGKIGTEYDQTVMRAYRHLGKRFVEADKKSDGPRLLIDYSHPDPMIQNISERLVKAPYHSQIAGVFEAFRTTKDAKIYRANPEFLTAMKRMDVELREELMPRPGFAAYYSFKPGVLVDIDGDAINGAYVYFYQKNQDDPVYLKVCYTTLPGDTTDKGNGLSFGNFGWLNLKIQPGWKFSDALAALKESPDADLNREIGGNANEDIFRTFLNLSMYVHSLSPDVSELKPRRDMTKQDIRQSSSDSNNLRSETYPVVLLNWSFGQERSYGIESTIRSAHLRWQPCGPGRSQTKLVIVREHEMKFKNVATSSQEVEKSPVNIRNINQSPTDRCVSIN